MVTRKPILSEGECDGAFAVTAIDEKEATVSMTHGRETLTLSLGQGPEEALANRALHFKAASFDQVLDIYQSLIRRTIISTVRFGREITLKSAAGLSAQKAAALLSQVFLEKGIAVKLSGENFTFLVDADRVDQLTGLSEPPPPISCFLHEPFLR